VQAERTQAAADLADDDIVKEIKAYRNGR